MTSTDNLLVPNKARHKKNAERLIDYYYEPKVGRRSSPRTSTTSAPSTA